MAAVTLLGSATFTTTSGTKTVTATPAVGDLIVIVTAHSGNTANVAPTDDNNSGTYTQVESCLRGASADILQVWVRDALISSAVSTVFSHAPGTTSGGGLAVLKVTGMTRVGAAAERQSAKQENQASGGTPTPVFGAAALTGNPVIGIVYNGDNPATVTPRGTPSYSELADVGHTVPTRGLEVMSINSGETGTSIAWGSTSATAFGDVAVELDSTVPDGAPGVGALALTGLAPTALRGTVTQPGAGSLALSMLTGSALVDFLRQPGAGAALLTGLAPVALLGSITQPGAGALTFAGAAPTVLLAALAQPGAGSITIAGLTPIGVRGRVEHPDEVGLTFTGHAPAIVNPTFDAPGVGALAFAGLAPTVRVGEWPARGHLTESALAYLRPRRIVAFDPNRAAQPEPGSLTITGQSPTVIRGTVLQPGAGALVLAGAAPAITEAQPSRPASDLAASGMAYLRPRRFVVLFDESSASTPAAGAMVFTGQAPSLLRGTVTQPAAGALALTGLAPTALVSDLRTVEPAAGSMAITGYAPALVSSSPVFVPEPAALAIFGYEPTIVVTSEGILSAKYLGGRRKNVPFKPLKKKDEPPKPKKAPAKPSPLLLGLMARGLAPPPVDPLPVVIVEPDLVVIEAPLPAPVELPPPPTPEELLRARVEALEAQMQAMQAEIAALRTPPIAAQPTPRDPVFEALHAILPAIGGAIDLDEAPPDAEPEAPEPVEPAPPAPPPRMSREEIQRENLRRAAKAAELLLMGD